MSCSFSRKREKQESVWESQQSNWKGYHHMKELALLQILINNLLLIPNVEEKNWKRLKLDSYDDQDDSLSS